VTPSYTKTRKEVGVASNTMLDTVSDLNAAAPAPVATWMTVAK
jgi:hypothetical protein